MTLQLYCMSTCWIFVSHHRSWRRSILVFVYTCIRIPVNKLTTIKHSSNSRIKKTYKKLSCFFGWTWWKREARQPTIETHIDVSSHSWIIKCCWKRNAISYFRIMPITGRDGIPSSTISVLSNCWTPSSLFIWIQRFAGHTSSICLNRAEINAGATSQQP